MRNAVLSYDDLLQIVELIKSAEAFSEFRLRVGDIELELRKHGVDAQRPQAVAAANSPPSSISEPVARLDPVPAAREPAPARPAADVPAGAVGIKSPMVGTFYRSPEPGARPFVEVGQVVGPDTTVCIIEVMKLMNSISAGCTGKVTQVLVNDSEPVEMGQLLIVIDPKEVTP